VQITGPPLCLAYGLLKKVTAVEMAKYKIFVLLDYRDYFTTLKAENISSKNICQQ